MTQCFLGRVPASDIVSVVGQQRMVALQVLLVPTTLGPTANRLDDVIHSWETFHPGNVDLGDLDLLLFATYEIDQVEIFTT